MKIDGFAFNDFLDFITANILLPVGGLLIVIFFIIRYLAPLAVAVILIAGLIK
ncbi:MAG: hypothetical protein IKM74_03030 [Bacteroidales bacterium]|nr:hypothetical protein [Bacteroidales bacterium]